MQWELMYCMLWYIFSFILLKLIFCYFVGSHLVGKPLFTSYIEESQLLNAFSAVNEFFLLHHCVYVVFITKWEDCTDCVVLKMLLPSLPAITIFLAYNCMIIKMKYIKLDYRLIYSKPVPLKVVVCVLVLEHKSSTAGTWQISSFT